MKYIQNLLSKVDTVSMENWLDFLKDVKKFVDDGLSIDRAIKIKGFLNVVLTENINWTAKTAFVYDMEAYRENVNAVSALLENLPSISPKDSFSIKEELKTLVDQSGININEFFTCNTDIINALLSNGHYKIAQDLRELGLLLGNSPAEQGALLIEPDRCFFILDTDYFQNIEVYSEWLNQLRVSDKLRAEKELEYFVRIRNFYGKAENDLNTIAKNPDMISKMGAALLSYGVYGFERTHWESLNAQKIHDRFKVYSKIWKHHGYKSLDDIYHTVTNYEEYHGKVKTFLNDIYMIQGPSKPKEQMELAWVIMQYAKPYWFFRDKHTILGSIIDSVDNRYTGYSDFSSSLLKTTLKDLEVKNNNINDKYKGESFTYFQLMNSKGGGCYVKTMLSHNMLSKISKPKESDIFLEKLYYLSTNKACFVDYETHRKYQKDESFMSHFRVDSEYSVIESVTEIYDFNKHIIDLAKNKDLYFKSLESVSLEAIESYAKFLSNHVKVDVMSADISTTPGVEVFKKEIGDAFNLGKDNQATDMLKSKLDVFSLPYLKNRGDGEAFIKAIEILKQNGYDNKNLFQKVEEILDKIEITFNIVGELSNTSDLSVQWFGLDPVVKTLENNYLQKVIPVNINVPSRVLKF